jgi:hypothetical protein
VIDWDYIDERVDRYNARPSDDLLYRIGSHSNVLEPEEGDGQLDSGQRFRILEWLLCQGYEIKGDLALLIFGKEQLTQWLEISRRCYPDFEFYLPFEFQDKSQGGWNTGIKFSLFFHPKPGAPMPEEDRDFPWRLDWENGYMFWGDGAANDFEFTLSTYPSQQSFTNPDWVCEEGDRYTAFTDEEADFMSVREVLQGS